MGQCDKREKAQVDRRERRFVNGAAGGSLLVAFSGISSCDGGEKGRDKLDRSMAIPSERDYHEKLRETGRESESTEEERLKPWMS